MQALAEFAESSYSGEANMLVSVNTDGFDHTFNINVDNKLVLQRVEVRMNFYTLLDKELKSGPTRSVPL